MDEFSVTRRRAGDAVVIAPVGEIDLLTVDEERVSARLGGEASAAVSP